jgi:hypothetical protein
MFLFLDQSLNEKMWRSIITYENVESNREQINKLGNNFCCHLLIERKKCI